jgi:hypothetical protein
MCIVSRRRLHQFKCAQTALVTPTGCPPSCILPASRVSLWKLGGYMWPQPICPGSVMQVLIPRVLHVTFRVAETRQFCRLSRILPRECCALARANAQASARDYCLSISLQSVHMSPSRQSVVPAPCCDEVMSLKVYVPAGHT